MRCGRRRTDPGGAWGRPSCLQKRNVHAVRKLGFGGRKIQVKIPILPPANHVTLVPAAGKSCGCGLPSPAWLEESGPWAWSASLRRGRSPPPPCWVIALGGNVFPVPDSVCAPLFCLSVCVILCPANPLLCLLPEGREWGPSLRPDGVCAAIALCQLQDGTAGRGGPIPTTEAGSALSLLYANKTFPPNSAWVSGVFFGDPFT